MNPCVLITSHLNNPGKEKIAHNLVDFLQDKGLPVIFAGNFPISKDIQEKVDWTLYTKENPKANRNIYGWVKLPDIEWGNDLYKFTMSIDYGYAHLLQTYRGFKLAQSLGYDHVIHFSYDISIDTENWNVLIEQIKLTPNIVWEWGSEYSTEIYTFSTEKFIKIMEDTLHYYKNNNPPDIHRGDWFCEAFFKWAVDKSLVKPHVGKEIKAGGISESQTKDWKYGEAMFFFYEKENAWLLKSNTVPLNISSLLFKINNETVEAKRMGNMPYFTFPHVEGECYFENKFMFNTTQYKTQSWIGTR